MTSIISRPTRGKGGPAKFQKCFRRQDDTMAARVGICAVAKERRALANAERNGPQSQWHEEVFKKLPRHDQLSCRNLKRDAFVD